MSGDLNVRLHTGRIDGFYDLTRKVGQVESDAFSMLPPHRRIIMQDNDVIVIRDVDGDNLIHVKGPVTLTGPILWARLSEDDHRRIKNHKVPVKLNPCKIIRSVVLMGMLLVVSLMIAALTDMVQIVLMVIPPFFIVWMLLMIWEIRDNRIDDHQEEGSDEFAPPAGKSALKVPVHPDAEPQPVSRRPPS